MLVGDDGAWPSDQRTADVTNVVKPTQFKSPHEDLCYKRRQSKPKTTIISEKAPGLTTFVTTGQKAIRKTPRIDDVCNNTHQATRRNASTTGVEGAGGTCRGAGGRRRGLAGLRDDAPSEARSADGSRAGRRPPAHTAAEPSGAQNTRGAPSNQATTQRKRAAAQRAAARSHSRNTQRSRAATTSATWTAFRAAPLRRLSPETTSTSPRLPSTAWS